MKTVNALSDAPHPDPLPEGEGDQFRSTNVHASGDGYPAPHRLGIGRNILIRYSKYPQSLLLQVRGSPLISFAAVLVAHPVDLYDQSDFVAVEIDRVRADGMLAAKLQSSKSTVSKNAPDDLLGPVCNTA